MSDYFGALMRSSGMAIADRAPAAGAPQASILAPPGLEATGETAHAAATPPVSTAEPASAFAPETAQSPPQREPARTAPTTVEPHVHVVAPVAPASDASVSRMRPATVEPTPAAATAPGAATQPGENPLRHSVVQAAMRWIAAGPSESVEPPPAASAITPPVPQASPAQPVRATPSRPIDSGIRIEAATEIARPAQPAPRAPADAPQEPAFPAPRAAAQRAIPQAAPDTRDETVEISIGAIHVRVDAPAAQTVARAPAQPVAAGHRAGDGPTPRRSALARRALRRI